MDKHFPKSTSWLRPAVGYTVWVKMPKRMTAGNLLNS